MIFENPLDLHHGFLSKAYITTVMFIVRLGKGN